MANKKFTLTTETKVNAFGVTLFRIKAKVKFGIINKGEKGGWAEKEDNIDPSGDAWVFGDAEVYGNARVFGDAWERSPVQIQGSQNFINECKKGYIRIGCIELSFEQWKKDYKKIGKKNGYKPKQIKEYGLYIDLIININKLKI